VLGGHPAAALGQEPDPIAPIERLVRAADFDAAELQARQVLSSGGLNRHDVARAHLQLGITAVARGDAAGAEASFRRALALERDLRLPPSAGPHVGRQLARALDLVRAEAPLAVSVTVQQPAPGGDVTVTAHVDGNRDGLVRRLRLRGATFDAERELTGDQLTFVERAPAGLAACAVVVASALDQHGNEIWPSAGRATICPLPPPSLPAPTPTTAPPALGGGSTAPAPPPRAPILGLPDAPDEARRPVPSAAWVTLAATAAAGVATGVLGARALSRRSDYQSYIAAHMDGSGSGAQALYDRAASAERYATVAGVVTAALGVATLALYYFRPRAPERAGAVRLRIGLPSLAFGASF
jgi:hypothetical protein